MKRISFVAVMLLISILLNACNRTTEGTTIGKPFAVNFSSFDGIQEFVEFVEKNSDQDELTLYRYDDSSGTHYHIEWWFSQFQMKEIASDITGTMLPKAKEGVNVNDFYGDYSWDVQAPLDFTYHMDGISYRFRYEYEDVSRQKYDTKPVLKNVKLGDVSFDLYAKEDRIYGAFMLGTTEVHVSIRTEDLKLINFENFELVTLVSDS